MKHQSAIAPPLPSAVSKQCLTLCDYTCSIPFSIPPLILLRRNLAPAETRSRIVSVVEGCLGRSFPRFFQYSLTCVLMSLNSKINANPIAIGTLTAQNNLPICQFRDSLWSQHGRTRLYVPEPCSPFRSRVTWQCTVSGGVSLLPCCAEWLKGLSSQSKTD